MALLGAYFDESGVHKDAHFTVVAGFVGLKTRWSKFEKKWKKVLDKYEVKELHMNVFVGEKDDFRGWGPPKRAAFLDELIGILEAHIIKGFAHGVLREDFALVKGEEKYLDIKTTNYQLCCEISTIGILDWRSRQPGSDTISILFEKKDHFWGEGMNIFKEIVKKDYLKHKHKIDELDTAPKKDHIQFQAADLLAYELYIHNIRRDNPDYIPRKSLQRLLKKIRLQGFNIHPIVIRDHFDTLLRYRANSA